MSDFFCFKITFEGLLPSADWEGRELEGLPETIHVRKEACLKESPRDLINVITLVFQAGSMREIVTTTRIVRIGCIVRGFEVEPQRFFDQKIINSITNANVIIIEIFANGVQLWVNVIMRVGE